MAKTLALLLIAATALGAPLAVWRQQQQTVPDRSRPAVERRLLDEGRRLLRLDSALPPTVALQRYQLDISTLRDHPVYLTPTADDAADYIWIGPDGAVRQGDETLAQVRESLAWLVSADGRRLLVDGAPLRRRTAAGTSASFDGWQLQWATTSPAPPMVQTIPRLTARVQDSFMRTDLAEGGWLPSRGDWRLKQHGGGMPTTDELMESYSFQRAVNPFTVTGHGDGLLTYGDALWSHARLEARFFFGRPRLERLVDRSHVPYETDMLVAVGPTDGRQVAFGWLGDHRAFAMVERPSPDADWTVLDTWSERRPPATNWVRISLEIRYGSELVGLVDGVPVLRHELSEYLEGPMHIASGAGLMEFDDMRAATLPDAAPAGQPILVRSRNFAGKKLKGNADPEEFSHWAQSDNTWLPWRGTRGDDIRAIGIRTRQPLFGDFHYESLPETHEAGLLPTGLYEFRLFQLDPEHPTTAAAGTPVWRLQLQRDADGWTLPDPFQAGVDTAAELPPEIGPRSVQPDFSGEPDERLFSLQFRRLAAANHRIEIRVGDQWRPSSPAIPGPVRLEILRLDDRRLVPPPAPEHHHVTSSQLVNEFFEDAPSEWSWVEGAFRMDARWACQDQWNFMACSAVSVPFASSKRRFFGDQEHEFFMSLRPNYPWDIGDIRFDYNPGQDKGFAIFKENNGWYVRRDLNFAFCSDGVNPLSGYSLVFAGEDNTRTLLMRRGEIVASVDSDEFLISKAPSHHVIHWTWWQFRVARYGSRIIVRYGDQLVFDYEDPEPLAGGHIGFWSVRSGFTISRVTSIADRIDSRPHVMYVREDGPSPWQPLPRDSVHLAPVPAGTRVQFNTAAGFQAVRQDLTQPVNLADRPVLELPLQIDDGVQVNLHLQISQQSYMVQLTAPTTDTRSFLTPLHDVGEQFQLDTISAEAMAANHLLPAAHVSYQDGLLRVDLLAALASLGHGSDAPQLESIAVGNTSNTAYLLAGHGGNLPGRGYTVGSPVLREAAP